MTSAAVGREDLERQLEVVRALAPGEMEGVFGPDSLTWRIDREALTFLGAGRALLLQLAHPWVAAAIAEHSKTVDDPIGRCSARSIRPCPRPEPCIAATPLSTAACRSPSDLFAPALRIKPTILQRCAGSMPPWLRPR
jgi:hypothetical protein